MIAKTKDRVSEIEKKNSKLPFNKIRSIGI